MNQDKALAVVYIFEKEAGAKLGVEEMKVVSSSVYATIPPDEIQSELETYIRSNLKSENDTVSSCIWALGKRYKQENVSFFTSILEDLLENDMAAAYQAMIALSNLGVKVLPNSSSLFDEKVSYEAGKDYLSRNA